MRPIALATDFNLGSAFCESLILTMSLACTRFKLSLAEVLVLDAPDWRYLAYHLGGDRFAARVKSGRLL